MKLLFDANLSPTLVADLRSHYHGSLHVRDIGLGAGSDAEIWERAKAEAFVIVWLNLGNAGTMEIVARLRDAHGGLAEFVADPDESLLVVSTDGRTV